MKRLLILGCVLLAGCATSRLESFIGEDVRRAVVVNGQPSNVMDIGDGRRAFQWNLDKSYTAPVTIDSPYYTNTTTVSGGQTSNWTCIYTLYARWNEDRQGWVIEGFENPPLNCE